MPKQVLFFLTTSFDVGPLIIIFTNNVKSSLGLGRLRDAYEVQVDLGLKSGERKKKEKKIKRVLKQLTVISHLFNKPVT
jgi:hypothetical protein